MKGSITVSQILWPWNGIVINTFSRKQEILIEYNHNFNISVIVTSILFQKRCHTQLLLTYRMSAHLITIIKHKTAKLISRSMIHSLDHHPPIKNNNLYIFYRSSHPHMEHLLTLPQVSFLSTYHIRLKISECDIKLWETSFFIY